MILFRKAVRSIWRGRRAFAACFLLIALGVASYVGFSQSGLHLLAAVDSLYRTQRFGEAFATVGGIPPGPARSLRSIEGVREVSARTSVTARFLGGESDQLTLRILSHDGDPAALNGMLLLEGAAPARGEIVLSKNFYEAQGLAVGDTVAVSAGGRQLRPVISGVATGPDYIVEVGEGLTGDGAVAGYAYMAPAETATLADTGEFYNELIFLLDEGVSFARVEPALEEALDAYGLRSLYGRDDHPGHYSTWMSLASLSSTAGMISFVFLAVAVLVLTVLLRRVIEQERGQIGTLKAFGFSGGRILCIYLGYGAVIGLAGCALGCLGGVGIALWCNSLYLSLFSLPDIPMAVDLSLLAGAGTVSLLAGLSGAALGARSVLRLSPAESMRPAAPPAQRKSRTRRRASRLPMALNMALRGISRGRLRSGIIAAGMAVSFAILAFMASYTAMMEELLLVQFDHIRLYDMKLSLQDAQQHGAAVQAARSLPGVVDAEGVLELSARFYSGHLLEDVSLTGLAAESGMYALYDSIRQRPLALPREGVVLSRALAEKLEVAAGDTLELTTAYTGEERLTVTVAEVVAENMGYTAYMALDPLCALLGAEGTVNSLLLRTDEPAAVRERLEDAGNIGAVTDQAVQRSTEESMLYQSLGANLGIFLIIGFGVALAIIVSTASIALSERAREYATMQVLGIPHRQVGGILLLEYLLLSAAGFLPGIPLAMGLRQLLISGQSEPLYLAPGIAPAHLAVGALICLALVLATSVFTTRHIGRLDMTEVLKERE